MKTIFLSLFCFSFASAFSQNVTASTQQRITFKLLERTVVEKVNNTRTPTNTPVKIHSASKWTIDAREVNTDNDLTAEDNDNSSTENLDADTTAIVYTVSKL